MRAKKLLCGALSAILAFTVCAFTACKERAETDYEYETEDLSELNASELENLAEYSVFYKPEDGSRVGDTMPYYEDGVYHIFYLKDGGGVSSHPVYRVDTTDFVHYEDKGLVLPAGDSNGGEAMIGTGSVLKKDGDYYFFYTGHPASGAETVRVAVSYGDLDHFVKQSFVLDPSDYGFENDFRDPEVRWSEEDGCYYCIVATRKNGTAVLAQFTLDETLEVVGAPTILYTDTRGFNMLECPTYFEWNGRYYITYSAQDLNLGDTDDLAYSSYTLTGSKGCVYYLCSEDPLEGWREPADPQLDSVVFYAGKVVRGSDTMLVGWAAQRDMNVTYKYAWGGNLVAHTLVQNEDGALSLTYPKSYASHFDVKQPLLTENDSLLLVSSGGAYNQIAAEKLEYRLSMKVTFSDDVSEFGLVFGLKDSLYDAVKVTVNPNAGKIKAQYGQNAEMANNFLALEADTEYRIDVFAEGSNFVLYIEGVAFTFKVRNAGNRKIALFAQDGVVEFTEIAMFAPSEQDLDFNGAFALASGESREFTVTAARDCYTSATVALQASGEIGVEIVGDGKTVSAASGKDVSLSAYANMKKGGQFTVKITAKEDVTVYGAIDGTQSHYVPVQNVQTQKKSENRGAELTGTDGTTSFEALVTLGDLTAEGRLILQKNGVTVASTEVKEGRAHLLGAVGTAAGDTLTAYVDFDGATSSYRLLLHGGAAQTESNLLPLGVNERTYPDSLGVEISPSDLSTVSTQSSFGKQGTDGFVYTYGSSIDEMQPCSNFSDNAVEEYEIQYTEPTVPDLIVRSDWIKTGSHYSAGVTYVASRTGTLHISLGIWGTDAESDNAYVLVQLYHNRNRILEYVRGNGWERRDDTVTLSVNAGDHISFAIRKAGYLTDDGTAAANYSFTVSDSAQQETVANFTEDFSMESDPFGNWECGWVEYRWDANGAIQGNTANTESFTYHLLTDRNEGGDGWAADGVEIKADWMSSQKYAAIVYTVGESMNASATVSIRPAQADTNVTVRFVVVDRTGKCKYSEFTNKGRGSWEHAYNALSLEEGDTVYWIFTFEEDAWQQTHFNCTIIKN